jgi:uncharacterized protein (UPF0276 family)
VGTTYEGRDPGLLHRILPFVDYLEITLETISEQRGDRTVLSDEVMAELREIQGDVDIIVHGVSLSIGSHDGWSDTYFRLLDAFLEQIEIGWHSEHLGYTRVDGEHLGIMLAMPKTEEALDLICERVRRIRERYPIPFLLENIVHVIPDAPGTYSDAAFLNALTERTGCGLILDTYNLEVDAHNHGFDVATFLREVNLAHVREIHVARGVEHNGFLLDVHSRLAHDTTIALAEQAVDGADGNVHAVVYEFMPEATEGIGRDNIRDHLAKLRSTFGE